jgi:hypothetical protein
MRALDRGVTEEERYWHGWHWALCWSASFFLFYRAVKYAGEGQWLLMGIAVILALLFLGSTDRAKKKYYLRRNNAQSRQDAKF